MSDKCLCRDINLLRFIISPGPTFEPVWFDPPTKGFDISWLTQILMERIKWVWLIDSQAAKQSHHQSLLTHLLTRPLTRAIHQSTNQWMGAEIRYTHWIAHLWPQGNWPADLCACYRKYDIYLSYTALLTQKNVRYIYYSQN